MVSCSDLLENDIKCIITIICVPSFILFPKKLYFLAAAFFVIQKPHYIQLGIQSEDKNEFNTSR